jgi:hypothetical protein
VRIHTLIRALLLLVFLVVYSISPGLAAPGTPDSLEFGFGGWLDLRGQHLEPAINAAASIGMNWIALDFDWAASWQDPKGSPDLSLMGQSMAAAKKANLNVMVSITNPPAWALTASGPNPNMTAVLVSGMKQLYPDTFKAVELFPEANTARGWGSRPDPGAYGSFLNSVCDQVRRSGAQVEIVAGGLKAVAKSTSEELEDLEYLSSLYQTASTSCLSIISIRLPELTGSPLAKEASSNQLYLRHYEDVRQVMLDNNHPQGILWITRYSWPSGELAPADSIYAQPDQQAAWLYQSYRLMRSQLYIGAAFFARLNAPSAGGPSASSPQPGSLIQADGSMHLLAEQLSKLVFLSGSIKSVIFEGNISKKTPEKINLKPSSP